MRNLEKREIRKKDVSDAKVQMRRDYLQMRNHMTKEDRQRESEKIQRSVEEMFPYQSIPWLFCYVSYKSEVETKKLLNRALQQGKKVAVPKVLDKHGHMEFYQIHSLDDLMSGYQGILEPNTDKCQLVSPKDKQVLM